MFDAQFSWPLAHAQAELALWEDRDQAAFQAIAEGLAAMSRAGDDTGWPVLYAVGLAAAADRAERVSARRATARLRLPGATAMPIQTGETYIHVVSNVEHWGKARQNKAGR
jgi:hypothetical protein